MRHSILIISPLFEIAHESPSTDNCLARGHGAGALIEQNTAAVGPFKVGEFRAVLPLEARGLQ